MVCTFSYRRTSICERCRIYRADRRITNDRWKCYSVPELSSVGLNTWEDVNMFESFSGFSKRNNVVTKWSRCGLLMWAEDHRVASAVMILPCSVVGSLSHRITLSLLFVTLLLLAHWIWAMSCIPGLRSSCFCFIHVPFSIEVTFNGAAGIKNKTLAGILLLFAWPG